MVLPPSLENRLWQSHLLKIAELRGMLCGALMVKTFDMENSSLGSIEPSSPECHKISGLY